MTELIATLTTPGVVTAIIAMSLASYICRVSGYFAMNLVPSTPRVRRALAALPGSIIFATVVPLIERSGPAAALAIGAALAAMLVRRNEILALAVGLSVAAAARAWGL